MSEPENCALARADVSADGAVRIKVCHRTFTCIPGPGDWAIGIAAEVLALDATNFWRTT
jgi:hypothetical protein